MSKVVPERTAIWMAIVSGALAFGAGGAAAANCEGLAGKNFGGATALSDCRQLGPDRGSKTKKAEILCDFNSVWRTRRLQINGFPIRVSAR
jgi:hypothetical protein